MSGVVIALCVCASSILAQPRPETFVGRRLEDALRVLQTHGLHLVFSSELVTPDMRVRVEPRAGAAREQLVELLQPHGLAAENGPGGVIQIVRKKTSPAERPAVPRAPTSTDASEVYASPLGAIYRERVTVTARADERDHVSPGIDRQLASAELDGLGFQIANDPLRVVQTLPGVATGDDFRSEYSMRGSEYRQAAVIIDGVVAPWLQHAALGRGDTGTLTMLRSDLVQDAALHVGAYPRVDSSQIGPQLNLTLREGSRTRRRFELSASATSATATAEGPLGSSARGSWLVGVRRSYNEWPLGHDDEHSTVVGVGDVQSKIVYDVRPDQQVSVSIIAGVSNVEREASAPFALTDGLTRAVMVGAAWRIVLRPTHTVVTQRVSSISHDFSNRNQTMEGASRGTNGAAAYRVDLSQPLFGGVAEAGGQVRRLQGSRHGLTVPGPNIESGAQVTLDDLTASWMERAVHASFRRAVRSKVTLAAGLRLSDSTLVHRRTTDRWLQAEWSVAPDWSVHGSTGVMHQPLALEQIAGWAEPVSLRPEKATYADVGVGHRLSTSLQWNATAFVRKERDALRAPDFQPRLIDGVLDIDSISTRFENALTGSARGIELTLARRSQTGLSGWISYSYGVARHTDTERHETFLSDFDQRHAVNITGSTALPWKARLGLTFRGGTNVPIPGYLTTREGRLVAGAERNQERLPAYARLDVRAERTFAPGRHRLTIFVEAINVLNRLNIGPADGAIRRDTGEAVGFTEQLFPRLLTAGLRFGF